MANDFTYKKRVADALDFSRMPQPSFSMIITAVGDYAYQRKEDGIFVVPIGCLKP